MTNELKFDVQFSRKQIENLLKLHDVSTIVFSGSYSFNPDAGSNVWNMHATAEGYSRNHQKLASAERGCPRPCYTVAHSTEDENLKDNNYSG